MLHHPELPAVGPGALLPLYQPAAPAQLPTYSLVKAMLPNATSPPRVSVCSGGPGAWATSGGPSPHPRRLFIHCQHRPGCRKPDSGPSLAAESRSCHSRVQPNFPAEAGGRVGKSVPESLRACPRTTESTPNIQSWDWVPPAHEDPRAPGYHGPNSTDGRVGGAGHSQAVSVQARFL